MDIFSTSTLLQKIEALLVDPYGSDEELSINNHALNKSSSFHP